MKQPIFLTLFVIGILVAPLFGDYPAPVNLRILQTKETDSPYPVQGHTGPYLHSLDPGRHESLDYWLDQFSTPEWLAWIDRALLRGEPYRNFIRSAVAERGLPWELEFLPVIESEFRSHAVSRSGAVGLWQFMSYSISPYDMHINEWLDERRDFWKATYGALAKLENEYNELGDWLLTLAAYNCGLGRVKRAIETAGTRDFWILAEKGFLPRQTVQYVPKFLAVSHIAGYGGRHGLTVSWDPVIQWERLELDQAVDLSILAREAGVPRDILNTGNAELRYGITPPGQSSYFLKVPAEYSDVIKETLSRQDMQLMRFYLHKIQSGDTFYALSRHFGVSVSMIERYNPNIDPRFLRIGATVVIPAIREVGPYTPPAIAQEYPPVIFNGVYTVKPGDSLWSISRLFDISPEILALNNNVDLNGILRTGTILQVPEVTILKEAGIAE